MFVLSQGIQVVSPMKLPVSRGFSFCCWFRVEAYPAPSNFDGPFAGSMGLFKFATEQGKGYTALIQESQIVIQVSSHFSLFCHSLSCLNLLYVDFWNERPSDYCGVAILSKTMVPYWDDPQCGTNALWGELFKSLCGWERSGVS